MQYEISKGTSGALASAVRKAEKTYEASVNSSCNEVEKLEAYEALEKKPVGRRPNFEQKVALSREKEKKAEADLEKAKSNQEDVRKQGRR